ncbi:MAG: hypothetical protein M1814_000712 [Vezdaea aestivalis]|nr:MAG: hypothetical protein M1814_000712 [Vezdaea aestivalis]
MTSGMPGPKNVKTSKFRLLEGYEESRVGGSGIFGGTLGWDEDEDVAIVRSANVESGDFGWTPKSGLWEPIELLGRGGQGIVYLWHLVAEDGSVLKRVVTKDEADQPGENGLAISQEARILRITNRTNCRNILRLYRYLRIHLHNVHRYYLEFCSQGDLADVGTRYQASTKASIPEAFLWCTLYDLSRALVCLERGRFGDKDYSWQPILRKKLISATSFERDANIHLDTDLKESNVFLANATERPPSTRIPHYPRAVLADFGHSQQIFQNAPGNADTFGLPEDFRGSGTPGYLAPEQLDDDSADDPLSAALNVWGIAISLLVAMHRNFGFRYDDSSCRHVHSNCQRQYSKALMELLQGCLAEDPKDRPRALNVFRVCEIHLERFHLSLPLDSDPVNRVVDRLLSKRELIRLENGRPNSSAYDLDTDMTDVSDSSSSSSGDFDMDEDVPIGDWYGFGKRGGPFQERQRSKDEGYSIWYELPTNSNYAEASAATGLHNEDWGVMTQSVAKPWSS